MISGLYPVTSRPLLLLPSPSPPNQLSNVLARKLVGQRKYDHRLIGPYLEAIVTQKNILQKVLVTA